MHESKYYSLQGDHGNNEEAKNAKGPSCGATIFAISPEEEKIDDVTQEEEV